MSTPKFITKVWAGPTYVGILPKLSASIINSSTISPMTASNLLMYIDHSMIILFLSNSLFMRPQWRPLGRIFHASIREATGNQATDQQGSWSKRGVGAHKTTERLHESFDIFLPCALHFCGGNSVEQGHMLLR